jgi:hypothetical protein
MLHQGEQVQIKNPFKRSKYNSVQWFTLRAFTVPRSSLLAISLKLREALWECKQYYRNALFGSGQAF